MGEPDELKKNTLLLSCAGRYKSREGHRRISGNLSPPKHLAKASASSGHGTAEHHEVAAIAAQEIRERRRRTGCAK
jgi:hypothetical protein